MRWTTEPLARCAALLLLLTTACSPAPSPTSTSVSPSALPSRPPSAEPSSAGEIEPGQPYTAADILEAMRTTPRPDGVPAELQTDAIAAAIAGSIWTIDGEPWDTILAGGSCGESSCQLEVAGSREGTPGDDVWTFGVVPSTSTVTVETTELRAIPEGLVETLDDLVRTLVAGADLEGMLLTSAAWQAPDAARYTVAYRSGGEEGSCGLEVVVEPRSEEIVDRRSIGSC